MSLKYTLLLIAIISTPTSFYCHDYSLNYDYVSSVVEQDQREIAKTNKEYVLRNAHLGVEVYPGFNIILSCVLDLLVHWGREAVTLLTDDVHFGSGSSKSNIVGWFKSKGIAINLKTITTLYGKESIEVSSMLNEGRDFIIICQSNLTSELLNMESQTAVVFKNYIIVDSKTPKLFENLVSVHQTKSQFIFVSPTYFGKIYQELVDGQINLFHIAYINTTGSWEMIKFANWSSNTRLKLMEDFDYYDGDSRLKNQSIRIAGKAASGCSRFAQNDQFKSLSMHLNFIVKCVASEQPYYGIYLGNGTFNGIIGTIQTRDADISSSDLYAQSNRLLALRFVAPQTFTKMTLWYREADAKVSPIAHVLAFNWSTWAAVLGALLVLTGVLAFAFIKVNIFKNGAFEHIRKWIFTGDMVIDIFSQMPGLSNKIILGALYVFVLLIFAHYNSLLKSFLINKQQETLFTNLEDIVQRKDYRVLVEKGAILHNYFMISDEEVHKDILRRILDQHDNLITNFQNAINLLCDEKAVLIDFDSGMARRLTSQAVPCKLVKKSQSYFTMTSFSAFRKDFPYESIFRTKQLKLYEGGIFKRRRTGSGYKANDAAPNNFALTLSHTLTPVSVLSAGIVCSMIALCIELYSYRLQQIKLN